ncbi:hypothetical protein AB1Y20_004582 [Prymnesium parvum]|uniref:Protein YIPF n=1 Tax=Prymnesium parvum TaxID=97485 RepID=A0AB34IWM0_PRYPA
MQAYMERQGYAWMFQMDGDEEDDDERRPLLEELEIDLVDIYAKLRWALLPPAGGVGAVSDFWGPVFVLMAYAALLVWGELRVISWIVCMWVLGGAIVFFVTRLLGADVTISHTLSSLGYCVLPLVLSRLILLLVGTAGAGSLAVRAVCTAWATFSASRWMLSREKELGRKQVLLVYPIVLYMFYFTAIATGV